MKKINLKNFYLPVGLLALLILIPLGRCFCENLFLNNDLWFLISHGQYVLENGIPTIEPLTMHENLSFVMQQWLSSVIFYLSYSALGKIGLAILVTLTFGIILFLIYKTCMLVSKKNKYLSVIVTLGSSLVFIPFLVGRPQIFSYLCLIALLFFLEKYVHTKDKRYLIALPMISVLLVNLHGSMWWMLLCFTLPYIIGGIPKLAKKFNNEIYPLKPLVIMTIVMFLAGLINPYGIDMLTYVFKSYGIYTINHLVSEMMVPDITTGFGKAVFLTVFIVLVLIIKSKNIKVRYALLLLGTLYLLLSAYRSYPLFVIASFVTLVSSYKGAFKNYKEPNLSKNHMRLCYIILPVIIAICFVINNPVAKYNKKYPMQGPAEYLLKHADKKEFIYTNYDDGSYLEFHGFKPYIDPRAEVFLKDNNKQKNIFTEYYKLQRGLLLPSTFLERYSFTYLVVEKEDILRQELEKNEKYELVYTDKKRKIFKTK